MLRDPNFVNFEKYFREPSGKTQYLRKGMTGVACANLRQALISLDYKIRRGDDFDDLLRSTVAQFQQDFKHDKKDGVVGQGTRELLITVLIDRLGEGVFDRMEDPFAASVLASWEPGNFLSLASLIDRDAPEIDAVLRVARRALGCGMGDLLQTLGPAAFGSIAAAAYEAIRCSTVIGYDYEPANPGESVQEVRLARRVLAEQVGTCLDLALLFAAILERAHVQPIVLIVCIRGGWHAMSGYLSDVPYQKYDNVITNATKIRSMFESERSIVVVETSGLSTSQGIRRSFSQSLEEGSEIMRDHDAIAMLNVLGAREFGCSPHA